MELSKEEKEAIKEFRKIYENDLRKYDDFNTYMQFIIERNGIILNLISKLQKENEKQSKVIDETVDLISCECEDDWIVELYNIADGNINELVKQYFYGKVEDNDGFI